MVQQVKDERGQTHEFPDDATESEMLAATNTSKNNSNGFSSYIPTTPMPAGINVISGLMSLAGKTPEQRNLIANIPEVTSGKQPGFAEKLEQGAGSYIPYAMAGGPSLLGQSAMAAAHGAINAEPNQKNVFGLLPSGKTGAAIEEGAGALAAGKLIPLIGKGMDNIFSTVNQSLYKINPKEVATSVQSSHDVLKNEATKLFKNVENEVYKRGGLSSVVPMAQSVINRISEYLPKTDAIENLINLAKTGDFKSLRKLQSELFTRGTGRISSKLPSDRDVGEEMLDLREKINNSISNHLKNSGNKDLDNILNEAKDKYSKLKEIYYSHPTIGRLVNEKIRKVPRNIMSVFSEDSIPMERLRTENKLLSQKVEQHGQKKNAITKLKYLGGLTGGGILSYPYLEKLRSLYSD